MHFKMRIRFATKSDFNEIVNVIASAFGDDYGFQRMFGCPDMRPGSRSFWLNAFARDLDNPYAHLLVVDVADSPSSPDGAVLKPRIIAACKWTAPGAPHRPPLPLSALPSDGDASLVKDVFDSMGKGRKELMGDRPHWYLNTLGVRMEWQGKGAGTLLVRWGIDKADEDGLEVYLGSKRGARSLYERHGFRAYEEVWFHDGKGYHTYMRRPAIERERRADAAGV
jgi:predicted N-acetyltransferase YhbS